MDLAAPVLAGLLAAAAAVIAGIAAAAWATGFRRRPAAQHDPVADQARIDAWAAIAVPAGLQWVAHPLWPQTGVWFRPGARVRYLPETDQWLAWRPLSPEDHAVLPSLAAAVEWLEGADERDADEPKPHKLSVRLTDRQHEALTAIAEERGCTSAEALRVLVDRGMG